MSPHPLRHKWCLPRRYPTSARSKPASRALGPPATTPPWARRCRSSARRYARRLTCVRDKRSSTWRPATAMSRWRRRGAGARSSRRTTCPLCSNAAASARRPSGSRSSFARPMPKRCLSPTPVSTRWFPRSASCSQRTRTRPPPSSYACASRAARSALPTDAGRLHRAAVQDHRQVHAAAGGRQVAGALGHRRAHHRIFWCAGLLDPARAARLRVSLPLCSALARRIQELLRPAPEDVRRPRPRDADGADGRSV